MSKEPRGFGWRKDRYDSRDFLHAPVRTVPDEIDLSPFIPESRGQDEERSCTGFGFGGNLTALATQLGLTLGEWFSPRWLYNGAKFIGGYLDQEGAESRDVCRWAVAKGCLLEHFWPYKANVDSFRAPPGEFEPEAAKYPVLKYWRVTNGLDGILSALGDGHFVSIGCPWPDAWMETDSEARLAKITKKAPLAGGHETFLFAASKARGLLAGLNSWRKDWSPTIEWLKKPVSGGYLMPFNSIDVLKQIQGVDLHYFTVEWKPLKQ